MGNSVARAESPDPDARFSLSAIEFIHRRGLAHKGVEMEDVTGGFCLRAFSRHSVSAGRFVSFSLCIN